MNINRLALATGLMLLSGYAYGSPILTNPGFESGLISPWTNDNSVHGGTWSIVNIGCHSGSYCAQDLGTLSSGNVGLEQTFSGIAAAAISNLSFWVNPSNNISVTLMYQGGNSFPGVDVIGGGGWQMVDLTSAAQLHGGTLTGIEVFGQSGTNASTMLDDFNLAINVPEPGAFWLLAAGLGTLGAFARRRKYCRIRHTGPIPVVHSVLGESAERLR